MASYDDDEFGYNPSQDDPFADVDYGNNTGYGTIDDNTPTDFGGQYEFGGNQPTYQPPEQNDYSSSFGPSQGWDSSIYNPQKPQYDWMSSQVAPQTPTGMYDFNTGKTDGNFWGPSAAGANNPYTQDFGSFGLTDTYNPTTGPGSSGGGTDWGSMLAKALFGSGGSSGGGTQGTAGRNQGIGSILESLVSGEGGNRIDNIGNLVSRVLPFFAANEEKKSAEEYRKLAEDQLKSGRAYMDPFGPQRGQYMDLLKQASDRLEGIYNAPSSSAMYQQAKNEMERRVPRQLSKNRMSMGVNRMMAQQSPELMKAALGDARDTFKMYQEPAGANIKPNAMMELAQAMLGAQKQSLTNPQWSSAQQFLTGNKNANSGNDAMTAILNWAAQNRKA